MDSQISVSIIFSGIPRISFGVSDISNVMVLARKVSHLSRTYLIFLIRIGISPWIFVECARFACNVRIRETRSGL